MTLIYIYDTYIYICTFVRVLLFETSIFLQKWTLGDVVAAQMWVNVVQCL